MTDLLVLCADKRMKAVVEAILGRPQALGIRAITFDVLTPGTHKDGGARQHGPSILAVQRNEYEHAVLMFDHHGCGDKRPAHAIRDELLLQMRPVWQDSGAIIIIEPELEAWLFRGHMHFREVVKAGTPGLLTWLHETNAMDHGGKPDDPKAAIEGYLEAFRVPPSSANYRLVASRASLRPETCQSRSYGELVVSLRQWFGS